MEPNQERPQRHSEPSSIQGPSKEALVGELDTLFKKLAPLCAPPGSIDSIERLWFHRSEFEVVNQVWVTQGISGVYERWGRERQFKGDDHNARIPRDAPILLKIINFSPADKIQDGYFTFAHLAVPDVIRGEFFTVLKEIGLLQKVMPERDSVRGISLDGAEFGDVQFRCEVYGSENPYGAGVFFLVDIAVKPKSGAPLALRLSFTPDGEVSRRLWDDELYETGYEGHDFSALTLSGDDIRALLPVVARVTEVASRNSEPAIQGVWDGNSLGSQ